MIIVIDGLKFKLLEVGGQSLASESHGSYPLFASYLTVGLLTEPSSMTVLFNLLNSLTARRFEGMIVSAYPDDDITLSSWTVRLVDDEDGVLYSCTVGYKTFMPKDKIRYKVT